ncbi:SET domain containing 4 [Elysia marginata]|uniref:SET domain containing 4 n=1 Tax=Elysia marginata TaxID=1093978 RepID=A0AAV4EJX9_9GAST|nr:SET domain containing 4 [Elysia marginata]
MRNLGRCGRQRKKKYKNRGVSQAHLIQFVQLQKWLTFFSPYNRERAMNSLLKPCDFKETGRGLQAMQKIDPGDIIVSIPLNCLITVHTVLATHIGSHIKRNKKRFTPQQILTIFLVIESCRGTESPWSPYIETLPDNYSTPLYFSSEEIALLNSQPRKQAEALKERFSRAKQLITKFIEENTLWPAHCFTEERLRWAWSTVDTRSVYLHTDPHPLIDIDPEESNVALAPFLDLLNHTDSAKMTAYVNKKCDCYEILTGDVFNKYDQVFISYGAHDNSKLLINYGFVLPKNVHNTYVFSVEDLLSCAPASTQHIERKTAVLVEANLQSNLVCSKDGISWSLSTALKIIILPWKLM